MSAEDDARARRDAWEAAGSPDYNNGGAPSAISYDTSKSTNTYVVPQVTAPRAPTVTQSYDSGGAPWSPYPSSAVLSAPGGAPAAPQVRVDPLTGVARAMSDADYQNLLDQAAEMRRQTGVKETQAQFQLDTARADQVANAAYQQSMIQYNNAQLAQAAADSARKNDIAAQQAETASRDQVATAAYQTGSLANQSFANQSQVNQWGQQNVLQGQAQAQTAAYQTGQLDIDKAAQVATAAYQQAIIAGNSATLAATIADNAARNEISRQQAETARAGQVSTAAYQQGQTANTAAATANEAQYRGMSLAQSNLATQQTRRQKRPYQPLRVSVA